MNFDSALLICCLIATLVWILCQPTSRCGRTSHFIIYFVLVVCKPRVGCVLVLLLLLSSTGMYPGLSTSSFLLVERTRDAKGLLCCLLPRPLRLDRRFPANRTSITPCMHAKVTSRAVRAATHHLRLWAMNNANNLVQKHMPHPLTHPLGVDLAVLLRHYFAHVSVHTVRPAAAAPPHPRLHRHVFSLVACPCMLWGCYPHSIHGSAHSPFSFCTGEGVVCAPVRGLFCACTWAHLWLVFLVASTYR